MKIRREIVESWGTELFISTGAVKTIFLEEVVFNKALKHEQDF